MPYITKEEVKEKRNAIKKAFPEFKFSVTRRDASVIQVAIISGPVDLLPETDKKYEQVNHFYISEHYQGEIKKVLEGVYNIAAKGYETAFEDSDYGSVPTFYIHLSIGKWDKPYTVVASKKKAPKKVAETPGVDLIDYSEKAIALTGDTKPLKEKLKELGGRFNPRLSCGPGWIFSKKRETELKEAFNL